MKPKAKHLPRAIAYGITLMLLLMAFVLSAVSCDFLSGITDNTPTQDTPGKDEPGKDEPGKDKPGQDEPEQDEPTVEPNYKWEFVPTSDFDSGYYYGDIPDEIERIDGYIAVLSRKAEDGYSLIRAHSIEIPTEYEGKPIVGLIGNYAYKTISAIDSLTIPSSILWVDEEFFRSNYVIEVCNYSEVIIKSAQSFALGEENRSPQSIITDKNESKLTQKGSYIFLEDEKNASLVNYVGSKTDLILPEKSANGNCYRIDESAFVCCDLTSVVLPEGVTSIADRAFSNCSKLIEICNKSSLNITAGSEDNGYIGYYAKHIITDEKDSYLSEKDGYVFYDDGTEAYLMGYNGSATELILPEKTPNGNDYAIYQYAFYNCSSLTSITIPSGVTSIGYEAFSGCSSLNAVYITDLAAWCGIEFGSSSSNPLCYAKNLYINGELAKDITIPSGVTSIGDYAFFWCSSLTSITIPEGVTSIGYEAFYGCSSLESITIPSSVKNIGRYAFYDCFNLETVTFAENSQCESIGSYAFYNCSSLTSITIPSGVTSIGSSAFYDCYHLIEVCNKSSLDITAGSEENGYVGYYANHIITDGNGGAFSEKDGYVFYDDGSEVYLVGYKGTETELILHAKSPEGTDYVINQYAFYHCRSLESITIPASVKSIGKRAFAAEYSYRYNKGDSSLTSVFFEENSKCKSIGEEAFYNCNSLENITLPFVGATINGTENTHFGYIFGAYSSWNNSSYVPSSLKTVVITGGTSIGSSAFSGCSSLTSITIPSSVTSIGDEAFRACRSLTSITIPEGVTSIGSSAFYDCYHLIEVCNKSSLNITAGSEKNGYVGYYTNHIITDENGGAFSEKDGYVFYDDGSEVYLVGYKGTETELILPAKSPEGKDYAIGQYAFYYCRSLTSITIPSGVTSIGRHAFYYCSSLTSITIPSSVTSIGLYAFSGCYSLQYNEYNGGKYLGNESNPYYALIKGTNTSGIHDATKVIAGSAFSWCSSLTSITIPSSVTSIGSYAFEDCSSLERITVDPANSVYHSAGNCIIETATKTLIAGCNTSVIPDDGTVTSIGDDAFYYCRSLTSITIPSGVTSIGDDAFCGCENLTSITIPSSVTSIGEDAFSWCSSLTSITFLGTKAQWNAISKGYDWNYGTGAYTIHCTDGDISE